MCVLAERHGEFGGLAWQGVEGELGGDSWATVKLNLRWAWFGLRALPTRRRRCPCAKQMTQLHRHDMRGVYQEHLRLRHARHGQELVGWVGSVFDLAEPRQKPAHLGRRIWDLAHLLLKLAEGREPFCEAGLT